MSSSADLDDALRHGVAIGPRDALLALAKRKCGYAEWPQTWPLPTVEPGSAADSVVRGMFEMVANHLRSPAAQAALAPLQLLVVLRGGLDQLDAWVAVLDDERPRPQQHLMVLRPAVFATVADRLLRALTCAEVWPELGDLSTCHTAWTPDLLSNQPRDPARFQLAMNMAMLATLVILYHEMAHILRGHNAAYAKLPQGFASLREHPALGMASKQAAQAPDLERRAMEVDADIYAGVFVASMLRQGALGEVHEEDLPHWCELLGFVAAVTFNAFEAHSKADEYWLSYHLPSTRIECFLEGAARGLGVRTPQDFAPGVNAGFEFCARHYQAPASLAVVEADIDELQGHTWPALARLRELWRAHVPELWMQRAEAQEPA